MAAAPPMAQALEAVQSPADRAAFLTQAFWCTFYGSGIIGLLVIYGLLQERIMTIPYDGVIFSYSVFLVFCNRVSSAVFGVALALYHKETLGNKAPLWKYLIVSLSNVYASTCQYECLKYVSFAVQMLGKSFKMMPVMVWGMIISRKEYGRKDWGVALAVTLGVTEFLMTGPTESEAETGNSFKGFLWLLGFLALDGLTSTMQEKLFKEHQVSKYNQIFYVNAISSVVSLITLTFTGALAPAFSFWVSHPRFFLDAALLSASATGSQWFIYSQVKEFGALVFAATMNVRQMVSILVSYATYGHYITALQILGLFMVFSALLYKSLSAFAEQKGEKAPLLGGKDAPKVPPEAGVTENSASEKP